MALQNTTTLSWTTVSYNYAEHVPTHKQRVGMSKEIINILLLTRRKPIKAISIAQRFCTKSTSTKLPTWSLLDPYFMSKTSGRQNCFFYNRKF